LNALDEVKSIVEGRLANIPFAQDVDKLIRESQLLTDNSARVRYALDTLQNYGINAIINVDYKNCAIKIFDYDFEELVNVGFYPRIEGNTGIIEVDGVMVTTSLTGDQMETFQRIVQPFNFWFTDKSANSYESFVKLLKEVPTESLEHHLYNDDFANWFRNVLKREDIADLVVNLKEDHLEGEELRAALLEILY
jgi:hypothetical protein